MVVTAIKTPPHLPHFSTPPPPPPPPPPLILLLSLLLLLLPLPLPLLLGLPSDELCHAPTLHPMLGLEALRWPVLLRSVLWTRLKI